MGSAPNTGTAVVFHLLDDSDDVGRGLRSCAPVVVAPDVDSAWVVPEPSPCTVDDGPRTAALPVDVSARLPPEDLPLGRPLGTDDAHTLPDAPSIDACEPVSESGRRRPTA